MSSVKPGFGGVGLPAVVPSESPATRIPPDGSSTATCPFVWPGVATIRSPNTSSPSATGTSGSGAAMAGMSSAPAYPVASGAASSTAAALPA